VLLVPRKSAETSTFGLCGVEAGVVAAVEAADVAADDADEALGVNEGTGLPFVGSALAAVVASMDPNDCTARGSAFMGGISAGEDESGADSLFTDPKLMLFCFAAPTILPLGTLTPSLMETVPPPSAEGLRECEVGVEGF